MMKNERLCWLLIFLVGCSSYTYEVCDSKGNCPRVQITKIVQPSIETTRLCNPNYIKHQARNECEDVPVNQLLLKGGTDKKYCNNFPYLASDYLDNWWNAEGLIDECEMPINSNIQFVFKSHDQSVKIHTGTIQIKIDVINYGHDFKALQVFTGENSNGDNLPDSWVYCGNVDGIDGIRTKYILCSGTNLQFIKLVNAEWNKGSLLIDNVEVLKA